MKTGRTLLWLCRWLQALGYMAFMLWLMAAPLMWILRDGLGPDSVETTGLAALWKFSPVLLTGLALAGYLILLHFAAWWLQGRDEEQDQETRA